MRRASNALLAVTALLLAAPFHAARAADAAPPAPSDHRLALEFGVNGVNLTSFDGATISLRRQTSEHAAWRYGLTVSGSFVDQTSDPAYFAGGYYNTNESHDNHLNTTLSIARLTYFSTASSIKPFVGVGADFNWYESLSEQTRTQHDGSGTVVQQSYDSNHGWGPSWGTFGLIGVEWTLDRRFALHSEYGVEVAYAAQKNEYRFRQVQGTDRYTGHGDAALRSWNISGRGLHTGVTVFW